MSPLGLQFFCKLRGTYVADSCIKPATALKSVLCLKKKSNSSTVAGGPQAVTCVQYIFRVTCVTIFQSATNVPLGLRFYCMLGGDICRRFVYKTRRRAQVGHIFFVLDLQTAILGKKLLFHDVGVIFVTTENLSIICYFSAHFLWIILKYLCYFFHSFTEVKSDEFEVFIVGHIFWFPGHHGEFHSTIIADEHCLFRPEGFFQCLNFVADGA